jgi:hypothetical protein
MINMRKCSEILFIVVRLHNSEPFIQLTELRPDNEADEYVFPMLSRANLFEKPCSQI